MKEIMIIGGGIAGLSAGIYGQLNGYKTTILEKNAVSGGECMGWDRDNHHIDGCIHWLVGTQPETPLHSAWTTVGALDHVEIYHPDAFLVFKHAQGTVGFYRDINRIEKEWIALSPEDKDAIYEFINDVKRLFSFDVPTDKPLDLMTLKEKIKFILSMKDAGLIMRKYGKIDLTTYAKRYKHHALQAAFETFLPANYKASSVFFGLAMFMKGQASLPMGGSLAFAQRMEKRYSELGGTLKTNSEVASIDIEGKNATSVTLKSGKTYHVDRVLCALDAHHLFHTLLKGNYRDKKFEKRFSQYTRYPLASQIQISLSVDVDLHTRPRATSIQVTPLAIHGETTSRFTYTHFAHEKTFAPQGKTVVTIAINQFDHAVSEWFKLRKDMNAYRAYKTTLGHAIIQRLEESEPIFKGKCHLLDVATPVTYARYNNAYKGAFMAFLPTLGSKEMNHNGQIKGLNNVYLTGQWLQPPGGLPIALLTGKDSIMRLCVNDQKPFVSKI